MDNMDPALESSSGNNYQLVTFDFRNVFANAENNPDIKRQLLILYFFIKLWKEKKIDVDSFYIIIERL